MQRFNLMQKSRTKKRAREEKSFGVWKTFFSSSFCSFLYPTIFFLNRLTVKFASFFSFRTESLKEIEMLARMHTHKFFSLLLLFLPFEERCFDISNSNSIKKNVRGYFFCHTHRVTLRMNRGKNLPPVRKRQYTNNHHWIIFNAINQVEDVWRKYLDYFLEILAVNSMLNIYLNR